MAIDDYNAQSVDSISEESQPTVSGFEPNLWNFVEQWMQIRPKLFEKIGNPRQDLLKDRVVEYAEAKGAAERLRELEPLTEKLPSETLKLNVTIFITVVGALTYGRAVSIIAAALPPAFLYPTSILGGGIASFVVDALATGALTNYVRLFYSRAKQQHIRELRADREEKSGGKLSFLEEVFWQERINLLKRLEISVQFRKFPFNVLLAVLLSVVEYTTAFWVVSNFFANNVPVILMAAASTLPVILTWAAANIKSQRFGLPEYAYELWPKYRDYLQPPADYEEEELENWYKDRDFEDRRLDKGVRFLVEEMYSPKCPTVQAAELKFAIDYYKQRIEEAKNEQNQVLRDFERQAEQDERELRESQEQEKNMLLESFERREQDLKIDISERQRERDNLMNQLTNLDSSYKELTDPKKRSDNRKEYVEIQDEFITFEQEKQNLEQELREVRDNKKQSIGELSSLKQQKKAEFLAGQEKEKERIRNTYQEDVDYWQSLLDEDQEKYEDECHRHKYNADARQQQEERTRQGYEEEDRVYSAQAESKQRIIDELDKDGNAQNPNI